METIKPSGDTALRMVRTAAIALNTKIGDITGNVEKCVGLALQANDRGVTLAVFPEGAIPGYPSEDYTLMPDFNSMQWEGLLYFADATKDCDTIYVIGLTVEYEGIRFNAQAWVFHGIILGIIPKEHLCNYWNFSDTRNFTPSFAGMHVMLNQRSSLNVDPLFDPTTVPMGDLVFKFAFGNLTGAICEDSWTHDGALARRCIAGDAVLCAVSHASDWRLGVYESRKEMLKTRSADFHTTIVNAYQVGGHTGTVYDGGALFMQLGRHFPVAQPLEGRFKEGMFIQDFDLTRVYSSRGANTTFRNIWLRAKQDALSPQPVIIDCQDEEPPPLNDESFTYPLPWNGQNKSFFIPNFTPRVDPADEFFGEIEAGLVLCLSDFVEKNGFERIVILDSGGRDSCTAIMLARLYAEKRFAGGVHPEELIEDFIHCFSMPSEYNTDETRNIARDMAAACGVSFKEIPIGAILEEERRSMQLMLGDIPPCSADLENVQARTRATLARSVCASLKAMLLGTGNATERGRGYYTKGGDQQADLNILGGVPKELVNAWLAYKHSKLGWPVFMDLLNSEASAELAPNQTDVEGMGPIQINDLCLPLLLGEHLGLRDINRVIQQNFSEDELFLMDSRYTPEMLEKWTRDYVKSYFQNAHKHDQDPPSARIGTVHIDPKRINRIPIVSSAQALLYEEK